MIGPSAIVGTVLGLALAIPFSQPIVTFLACAGQPERTFCSQPQTEALPTKGRVSAKTVSNPTAPWKKGTLNWLMADVGFKGQQMKDMSAILIGESGIGNDKINAKAHNCDASTGDDSRGLGQVNLLGPLIERLDTYNLKNPQALYDPKRNMQITYELAQTPQGYKHWGSYNQGTYLKFYGRNPVIVSVDNPNCRS